MDSLIGKTIDSYRILEVIGRGGMGVVFKALDTNLEKIVALKMIDPFLARDENFVRRFKTEAKALAKLVHPGIVIVHAFRETDSGLFMVMEFVESQPLSKYLEQNGSLNVQNTISISKQLLNAIGHAHKAGVIHRDIKPSNILLTNDGIIKVTDFGLAKVIEKKGPASTLTQAKAGTLYYMSPEQVKALKNVDARSDLYSLGMTIYEMITGRVPFEKTDSDYTIQKKIVEGEIPSPIVFKSSIPSKLVSIITKSINTDPNKRYQKAEEMLQDFIDFEKEISVNRTNRKSNPEEKPQEMEKVSKSAIGYYLRKPAVWFSVITILSAIVILLFILKAGVGSPSKPVKVNVNKSDSTSSVVKKEPHPIMAETNINPKKDNSPDQKNKDVVSITNNTKKIIKSTDKGKLPNNTKDTIYSKKTKLQTNSFVLVPMVKGLIKDEATNKILSVGLKIGKISYGASGPNYKNLVILTIPKIGSKVEKGTKINIVLGE